MAEREGLLGRVAARVEAIARAVRGPETSTVADVPGAPHYGFVSYGAQAAADKVRKTLESWGVYSKRISPLAGPTRTRWALWPGDDLTPETIIAAQRSAVTSGIPLNWIELIDQIFSRDGHYAAVTVQRVEDVIKGTWRLTRAADDDAGTAMRNFAAEAYGQCSRWRDGLGWLLMSNLYGYNACEVEWHEQSITFKGPKGETIGPVSVAVPKRLHNTHPKHFRFDVETDDPLFWIGGSYQPLPIGKFVFMDGEGLHPIKVRRGHAWQCIWYSMFRSIGWSAWAVHVDRFSLPVPIIEYDGDIAQYNEYQAAYSDILNSLGQGKGAILPRSGATFNIKDPPAGGRSSDPASALSDACDSGQSIRVIGATLTAKIGNVGSFSATSNHMDVKYAKEENDAGRLWERIDEQLTDPMIRFNAEALAAALQAAGYKEITAEILCRRVPKGKHRVPRESDPTAEMNNAATAVNELGLPLSMEGMFDRIDFPRATSDEDRIPGKSMVVAKGGAIIPTAKAADEGGVVNPDEAALKAADNQKAADGKSPDAKQETADAPKDKPGSGKE